MAVSYKRLWKLLIDKEMSKGELTPYVYEMVNTIAYSFADGSITVLD